ncbi:hypothetical protein COT62_03605 [Candidatus Roizmanbacteria bacterium CG09_land_8_20_14_0_10_41_9]|uniref:5'-deoxynucleotidase n=1 Tax=Candidatus Roizmanbacteria bacterium CG09_land_8_20_14_0_10_41_9 TaxID=1974850 RepID=A0A2H0WU57_9BACT|nr:MAG: hypothetical protein COT62_03605 [Candidatus Roizmanbacteria bacterium CG09_land_8_20_14_0_10_41_9]
MLEQKPTFGSLFRKFRLKSGFSSLREFGDILAKKGFTFEDSLFSHWQKNTRLPKDRKLLLTLIEIFLEREGISSARDINSFLESAGQGCLTEQESTSIINQNSNVFSKLGPPGKVLSFLVSAARSKKIIREGWRREGIKDPESVAEHSFQLSIIAMIFADQFGLDKEKLIKMAILHDLGEVVTEDIVWARGKVINIEKQAIKEKAELIGITKLFNIIGKSTEYENIFKEMVEKRTPEAEIFWQLDKLEMAIQALEYEKEHRKKLDEFFINSDLLIHSPFLRKILMQIIKQRPKIKNKSHPVNP